MFRNKQIKWLTILQQNFALKKMQISNKENGKNALLIILQQNLIQIHTFCSKLLISFK